jgi:hypothetical protein
MERRIMMGFFFFISACYNQAEAQQCNCPGFNFMVYQFNPYAITPKWYKGKDVKGPEYSNEQQYQYFVWTEIPHLGADGFVSYAAENSSTLRFSKADVLGLLPGESMPMFVDYIITGEYDTSEAGGYNLQVKIENTKTKKQVAETSVRFSALDSAEEAGRRAAIQLSPLLDLILKYEHQVRDVQLKDQSAIEARYELEATKTQLNTAETTMIQLKLFDCDDGAPLRNRKVNLKLPGGASTISPGFVITDANGRAQAIFKAGQKSETVTVRPLYQYTSVSNKKTYASACTADLQLEVLGTLTEREKQNTAGKIKWHITISYEEKISSSGNSKTGTSHGEFTKAGKVDMYVLSELPEHDHVFINTESDKLLSATVTGEVIDKSDSKTTYSDGYEYRKDEFFGEADKKAIGIRFEYDPAPGGTRAVNTGIQFNKKGHSEINRTATDDLRSWNDAVNDDYGSYSATIGGQDDKIQKLKNGFVIDGGSIINKEEDDALHGHNSEKGFIQYHITIIRE